MSNRNLRLAILWTGLSGYFNAWLHSLVDRHNVELLVFNVSPTGLSTAPYADSLFTWLPQLHVLPNGSRAHLDKVQTALAAFGPDAVLVSGWSVPVYRHAIKRLKKSGVYVISGMDNPWQGTLRQWIGVFISQWYLHRRINALWVPGERAASFARRLGFTGNNLMYGLYSADSTQLKCVAEWRLSHNEDDQTWPRRFIFVGRLVEIKGLPELLDAYTLYRDRVESPWELWCAGSGPLESMLQNKPGVRYLGFIQPDKYGEVLKQASIFVLPSRHDPWGLVIHEATSAGLPILCSHQTGSSVELVQDGFNGFLFEAGDVAALADLMYYMSSDSFDLAEFGRRSALLSTRYSPQRWADYLCGYLQRSLKRV